ncbi:MAG: arylesterase [Pseudomonadales bacterium]|nr:arylesterase [Pseudomonadales bacterium]
MNQTIRTYFLCLCASLLFAGSSYASADFTVLFLGDSLTEGYGLEEEQSFPSLIAERLAADGYDGVKVINAGISGSTSASALSRLQWYIRAKPDLMILSLGANDGLRGLSTENMKKNLIETIEHARQNGIEVALTGMLIPPNYGPQYSADFAQVFPDLAEKYQLPFLPFLLEGVAGITELNQGDGIHPNVEGTKIVAHTVYEFLKPLLPQS